MCAVLSLFLSVSLSLFFSRYDDKLMALHLKFDGEDFVLNEQGLRMDVFHPTSEGETGFRVWDAGIVLAKYLDNKYSIPLEGETKSKRLNVLELGAGSGIAGFGAAFGGHHVWLTDKEVITARTTKNIELNQAAITKAGGSGIMN